MVTRQAHRTLKQIAIRTALLSAVVVIPCTPGHAQFQGESFGDFWVGGSQFERGSFERRRYQSPEIGRLEPFDGSNRRYDSYAPEPYGESAQSVPLGNPPKVQVESPQYYSYKADQLQTAQFEKLCEIDVASENGAAPNGLFARACAFAPSVSLRMLPEVGKALQDFYASHPGFLWLNDGKVSTKALAALSMLSNADRFGLVPADYRVALPKAIEAEANPLAEAPGHLKDLMRFELALSGKVLTYVLDATRGRVDPNRISGYHDLPRKNVDLAAVMSGMAQAQNIGQFLEQRQPQNRQFQALVAALAKLRSQEPRQPVTIASDTVIHPGESNPELAHVIAAIRQTASAELKRKYADVLSGDILSDEKPNPAITQVALETTGTAPDAAVDKNIYNDKLVALVRDFQAEKGLHVDGIIGGNTIHAVTADSTSEKIEKIRLAMERLRWLPRQFGDRYVFLNEPAFEVSYIESGHAPLSMRVVVGKTSNQTYFFTDKIKAVEYNPYWGVPRSIIINEMLPKLYRDPSYLDRLGYEVTTQSGRPISSTAVDWASVAHDKSSVNVRQPPGRGNALGRVKIEFPNKHAIYLHDTPAKKLFNKPRRAFSHGCVRLQHPRQMAAAILGKSVDYIGSQIARGDNHTEAVEGNIPVYLTYFTAWPDEAGAIRFYDDVYKRDMYLSRALKKTEQARAG